MYKKNKAGIPIIKYIEHREHNYIEHYHTIIFIIYYDRCINTNEYGISLRKLNVL
jgi:hypothetical protein